MITPSLSPLRAGFFLSKRLSVHSLPAASGDFATTVPPTFRVVPFADDRFIATFRA